ncbi:HNH endonuclease [Empedobacter brevis]|uniref:HNH endonuclease n=1 Tax=Empedobacter brevis TaxID=247 RepID=UPI0028D3297A|nr:HNH endonuclease [Empedobacter brevis]
MNPTHLEVFNIGTSIINNEISRKDGIDLLVKRTNLNRGSAQMILGQIFPKFFVGKKFTRTLTIQLFDDLLLLTLENYGIEKLEITLSALKQHIDYIKTKGDSKIKLRKVFQKYCDIIKQSEIIGENEKIVDNIEQEEIVEFYKNKKDRNELIIELEKNKNFEDGEVIINVKKYKRDNKSIALIKLLRNFECQICNHYILKKDGSKYIEAAHINPKHKKGKEIDENIILLCPNHHKEFDYGNLNIIEHTKEKIIFELNDIKYTVNLKIA